MPAPQSLAGRAEVLLNRLAQVQAQEADQHARSEIERARSRANMSRQALDNALRAIPKLAGYGIARPPVSDATATELAKARTALRSAATSIIGAPLGEVAARIRTQSVNNALDSSERFTRNLVAGLNRTVDKKRQEIQPVGIDKPIVPYPGVSDVLIARLERIKTQLQRPLDSLDPDALVHRFQDILSAAESWKADRRQLDESLQREHPEVRKFLGQAATDEGARWDLITPSVKDWLSNPENTVNMRIVLR